MTQMVDLKRGLETVFRDLPLGKADTGVVDQDMQRLAAGEVGRGGIPDRGKACQVEVEQAHLGTASTPAATPKPLIAMLLPAVSVCTHSAW